jgi:hypothetical protein
VGSNPTRGIDICGHVFCVFAVLCLGNSVATGWSIVQGVPLILHKFTKLKKWPGPNKGCRATDKYMYVKDVPLGKVSIPVGNSSGHSKHKVYMYICPIPKFSEIELIEYTEQTSKAPCPQTSSKVH